MSVMPYYIISCHCIACYFKLCSFTCLLLFWICILSPPLLLFLSLPVSSFLSFFLPSCLPSLTFNVILFLTHTVHIQTADFLHRFQLSPVEVDTLYRSSLDDPQLATAFFLALDRLREAYSQCRNMASNQHYSAGFELLDLLGHHSDTAYRRLFEWVQTRCDALSEPGFTVDDLDSNMQRAIRYLRRLQIYYRRCQDLVANFRRAQLVQSFVAALMQGAPSHTVPNNSSSGVVKAMDLLSPDPVRYVGDILAWLHQAMASEKELLRAVFAEENERDGDRDRNNSRNGGNGGSEEKGTAKNSIAGGGLVASGEENAASPDQVQVNGQDTSQSNTDADTGTNAGTEVVATDSIEDLLSRCLQGLGRPLRVRVLQALESCTTVDRTYALADLLSFYSQTFHSVSRGVDNIVSNTVEHCLMECKKQLGTVVSVQAEQLMASPAPHSLDLGPTFAFKEVAHQIHGVIRVHQQALSSLSSSQGEAWHINAVLASLIGPLLQSCRLLGKELSKEDAAVFASNSIFTVHRAFQTQNNTNTITKKRVGADKAAGVDESESEITEVWEVHLQKEITQWTNVLAVEEAGKTLHRSDLDKLLFTLQGVPEGVRCSDQPGCSEDYVASVLRAFYSSLFSYVTMSPQLDRLLDPIQRESARRATAEIIAKVHHDIHELVQRPTCGYASHAVMLVHTPAEVRVLLNCSD